MSVDPFRSLPSLIRITETSLSVAFLAATELESINGDMSADEARRFLDDNGFDAAPIAATRPSLFVDRGDLSGSSGKALESARPLAAPLLVTSTLSLAEGVHLLHDLPYYFILEGHQLTGIVTRADLQRQAVSMVLLGFVLASEVGMNALIPARLGKDWMDELGDKWRADVEALYEERVRSNTQLSRLDCLMVHQRCRSWVSRLSYVKHWGSRRIPHSMAGPGRSLSFGTRSHMAAASSMLALNQFLLSRSSSKCVTLPNVFGAWQICRRYRRK